MRPRKQYALDTLRETGTFPPVNPAPIPIFATIDRDAQYLTTSDLATLLRTCPTLYGAWEAYLSAERARVS